MNTETKLAKKQLDNLLDFEDQDFPQLDLTGVMEKYEKDPVFGRVLRSNGKWLTKVIILLK